MYILEHKNVYQPDCKWIKVLGPSLALQAKNAVNFQLKLKLKLYKLKLYKIWEVQGKS